MVLDLSHMKSTDGQRVKNLIFSLLAANALNKEVPERINCLLSLIWHGLHRNRHLQFFAAARTCLPSYYLAMKIGIHFTKPMLHKFHNEW
jgi:hypothetical protein